ncbi:MAG: hypothetical protein M1824_001342 [Vezdaea acicularis]|nr:MAG: hypothetical protein M1824_001342 [Vezdaea acicularis]
MIIYKDIITGDEIISDSYDLKEVDSIVYEVDCKMITKGGEENINIGANPSAEEQEEEMDTEKAQVIDIVDAFRLHLTQFDKKSYQTHLKGYMKAVKSKLQEQDAPEAQVQAFQTGAAAYAKKIFGDFKNYDFYIGESMDPDGMVVLINYRPDGITPYATIWKDGLTGMKV